MCESCKKYREAIIDMLGKIESKSLFSAKYAGQKALDSIPEPVEEEIRCENCGYYCRNPDECMKCDDSLSNWKPRTEGKV